MQYHIFSIHTDQNYEIAENASAPDSGQGESPLCEMALKPLKKIEWPNDGLPEHYGSRSGPADKPQLGQSSVILNQLNSFVLFVLFVVKKNESK